MSNPQWIIDAFTSVPFRGNAAAVCLLQKKFPEDAVMQLMAQQNNLSETAFLVQTAPLAYKLRWFTPELEVKLCGHATLAAVHMMVQMGNAKAGDVIKLDTLSGQLSARVLIKGSELNFPTLEGKDIQPHAALDALGVELLSCERNETMYLAEVRNFETLIGIAPDFKKLKRLDALGVIVTTAKGVPPEFDFASRFFAPGAGIDEDPVTGSAHCMLAPYWAKKLKKQKFHALQASRGYGILDVTLEGARTKIAGNCMTTLKGTVELPKAKKDRSA